MKKSRFSEHQIIKIRKEVEAGRRANAMRPINAASRGAGRMAQGCLVLLFSLRLTRSAQRLLRWSLPWPAGKPCLAAALFGKLYLFP